MPGWRAPGDEERRLAWVGFAVAAGTIVLAPLAPLVSRLTPSCFVRRVTGLPCPTCGSTRAIAALTSLEWAEAVRVNPLAAATLIGLVAAGLAAPLWIRAGGKIPVLSRRARVRVLWGIVAAVAANWIYLAVSGT